MIEIENVSRRYGTVQALKNVSVKVEKGAVLGLLGQNGAGKTTLLNIITGYLAPGEGRVLVNGFDPLLSPEEAKRCLGYLPEQPPLYDEMTVREYLVFAAKLRGVVAAAARAHVNEIMGLCGLSEVKDRLIGHLSKGYRQRTGLAQALCGDPEVLVLDEPTVGLDPKQVTEVRALIRELAKEKTILFSSHILSEVQQLCTHAVILDRGEVCLNAPMDSLRGERNTLLLRAAGPERTLGPRLRELRGLISCSVKGEGEETEAALTFAPGVSGEKAVFSLLREMNIPILRLAPQEDSLERVFLDVISR